MNWIKLADAVFILGVALAACNEGRNDPLAGGDEGDLPEGRLTKGTNGPNLAVTPTQYDSACQEINEEVFSAFAKAGVALSLRPKSEEPVRFFGDYSGHAVVDGSASYSEASVQYDCKVIFYDYSDSTTTFLGGSLQYQGYVANVSYWHLIRTAIVDGEIHFAGRYAGSMNYFDFELPTMNGDLISLFAPTNILRDSVRRRGKIIINSGGNTFTINPYPLILTQ